MNIFAFSLLAILFASSISAQQQQVPSNQNGTESTTISEGPKSTTTIEGPNLSIAKVGRDDLVGISVYDAPELTRNVRVDAEGNIRLPMVRQHIQAAGLLPGELEGAIAAALVDEHVLIDPVVTVSVVEYHSRPITVVGAVRNQTTFQATGTVSLLDAITRAGGITNNAGAEILVNHSASSSDGTSTSLIDRIPVHSIMDATNPAANLKLEGGEVIRVPEAGQIVVVGNVKHPGAFPITNDSESSVMKIMALTGGLDSFTSGTAYIYRIDGTSGSKNQIPVEIKKIMARKSPDVPLYGDDMLYVPTANGTKVTARVLGISVGVGLAVASLMLFVVQ